MILTFVYSNLYILLRCTALVVSSPYRFLSIAALEPLRVSSDLKNSNEFVPTFLKKFVSRLPNRFKG